MSTRVHTTNVNLLNVRLVDRDGLAEVYGYDDVDDAEGDLGEIPSQALVFEDGGNQEAWVIEGSINEFASLLPAISTAIGRPVPPASIGWFVNIAGEASVTMIRLLQTLTDYVVGVTIGTEEFDATLKSWGHSDDEDRRTGILVELMNDHDQPNGELRFIPLENLDGLTVY